jgi:WXG100 family type VII secretion target
MNDKGADMSTSKIRAEHNSLQQIAQTFHTQADQTHKMYTALKNKMAVLSGGDWVGKGATKFYAEMDGGVLPAVQRLNKALAHGSQITLKISNLMQQADDDVARLFKGGLESSGGSGMAGGQAAAFGGAASGSSLLSSAAAITQSPAGRSGETPNYSSYKSKADGAGNGVVGRMLKNLSPEVRELAAKSPTLLNNLEMVERLNFKIAFGSQGDGSGTENGNREARVIVIETGHDVEKQVSILAHEAAHAVRGQHVVIDPIDLPVTKDEWIKTQVEVDLNGEGNSVMHQAITRDEIIKAGGPDIAEKGHISEEYLKIYQEYKNGQEIWDGAVHRLGQLYANARPSGQPEGTIYRDYYTKSWVDFWDKDVAPVRAKQGRQ